MITNKQIIPISTIIVHSIGCGCDDFWQVIESSNKYVIARKIEDKAINVNVKRQTCDYVPVKDKFLPPKIDSKYVGGYKEGKSRFKKIDIYLIKLKVVPDSSKKSGFRVGTTKRMIWWSIWQGKPLNQWCS